MTRSSRHKSHKQSKHSAKDYSDSEREDVKMKEKERGGENDGGSGLIRISKDLVIGEKRKLLSQLKDGGKEGKDLFSYGNVDAVKENVSSKRRKEKVDTSGGGGGGGERDDVDKSLKSREKSMSELKCRSSKRHDSGGGGGGEKKVENVVLVVEKEEEVREGFRVER